LEKEKEMARAGYDNICAFATKAEQVSSVIKKRILLYTLPTKLGNCPLPSIVIC
jgi:hypothetical protein